MKSGRPDSAPAEPRDPRVDAAWRAASREEPPAALDAAILAAARRAVDAGPQRAAVREATRPERWWWPLAAAASIGAVAIGVLQLTAPDRAGTFDASQAIVSDLPAGTAPAPASSTAFVRGPERASAPPSGAALVTPSASSRNDAAPQSLPPLAESLVTPAAPSPRSAGGDDKRPARAAQPFPADAAAPPGVERDSARPERLGKVVPGPATATRGDMQARELAPRPAAEWIVLIRKLKAEGKREDLAREIAAFQAAYPDLKQRLADELRGEPLPSASPPR